MKDYRQLRESALSEVIEAGIEPGVILHWGVNTRAKSFWGRCIYKKMLKGYYIEIAQKLLTDERISEIAVKETIIHEILHTCKDSMKHTGNWKTNAERMNALYGYRIKRVTQGEEKGVENYEQNSEPYRYAFRCRNCGAIVRRKRPCKFTKYYALYTCGRCNAKRAFEKYPETV